MDAYPDVFDADIMILTDCDNPSVDLPGLTVSLRGLLEVELTVQALEADVHSGIWGGMTPDVSIMLIKLMANIMLQKVFKYKMYLIIYILQSHFAEQMQ